MRFPPSCRVIPAFLLLVKMHGPRILRMSVALLAFPLMGSSCETLETSSYSPAAPQHDVSSVAGYSAEIDRVQSIRDPNQRAAANVAFVKSLMGNLDASMQQAGIDPNQMAYQSTYQSARQRGMTPYEADAEARQFQQMRQQMMGSNY